jgi:hypothetical protein
MMNIFSKNLRENFFFYISLNLLQKAKLVSNMRNKETIYKKIFGWHEILADLRAKFAQKFVREYL